MCPYLAFSQAPGRRMFLHPLTAPPLRAARALPCPARSASQRPTIVTAARAIMAEGRGLRPFFRGVGPRALSNGLNSAIFFCFFEAIRQVRRAALC